MEGLFGAMQQLYGLTAEVRDDVDTWQPEVTYYALRNEHGEEIG